MNQKIINEINEHTNPSSCLFIGRDGILIRVFTPFKVRVINQVDEFKIGQILQVGKVMTSKEIRVIYIINDKPYFHSSFQVIP